MPQMLQLEHTLGNKKDTREGMGTSRFSWWGGECHAYCINSGATLGGRKKIEKVIIVEY